LAVSCPQRLTRAAAAQTSVERLDRMEISAAEIDRAVAR
jgi:hypothetical protein